MARFAALYFRGRLVCFSPPGSGFLAAFFCFSARSLLVARLCLLGFGLGFGLGLRLGHGLGLGLEPKPKTEPYSAGAR